MKNKETKKLRKELKEFYDKLNKNYYLTKMVKVNDDWHPNYPKHLVAVSLRINWFSYNNSGNIMIHVAGKDDTAVSKYFSSKNINDLYNKWDEYKKFYDNIPQTTNKRWYLERGFDYC